MRFTIYPHGVYVNMGTNGFIESYLQPHAENTRTINLRCSCGDFVELHCRNRSGQSSEERFACLIYPRTNHAKKNSKGPHCNKSKYQFHPTAASSLWKWLKGERDNIQTKSMLQSWIPAKNCRERVHAALQTKQKLLKERRKRHRKSDLKDLD